MSDLQGKKWSGKRWQYESSMCSADMDVCRCVLWNVLNVGAFYFSSLIFVVFISLHCFYVSNTCCSVCMFITSSMVIRDGIFIVISTLSCLQCGIAYNRQTKKNLDWRTREFLMKHIFCFDIIVFDLNSQGTATRNIDENWSGWSSRF